MNIFDYLGNYHPLLVHLPIGILCLFLVMAIFISRNQLKNSRSIIRFTLLLSALSATGSSITGLLIANAGEYEGNLVTGHQIMGIALTLVSWLLWFRIEFLFRCRIAIYRTIILFITILLTLTGHAGGSLTHGSDFLAPPPVSAWFSNESAENVKITFESSAFEATSLIFNEKCVVCHGKNKQKGKLRLDNRENILAGGSSGDFITANALSSLLIERILLPLEDEDHMPPKERKQLTKDEIGFLIWWIESGASFEETLSELNLPDSLHTILTSHEIEMSDPLVPDKEVPPANYAALQRMNDLDLVVIPIADGSNYLSVSFINVVPEKSEAAMSALVLIKDQLVWLNLDYQDLSRESWNIIGELKMLRKLSLKNSNISDEFLPSLNSLSQLRQLNLVSSEVSAAGINDMRALDNLRKLYIYDTHVSASDMKSINSNFPNLEIDLGQYQVPILRSDTTVLTKKDLVAN